MKQKNAFSKQGILGKLILCVFVLVTIQARSQQFTPNEIYIGGELEVRMQKNMDRLEEEKYQPDHVFLTEKQSGDWPGDTEGRTILALVREAQATHRTPRYLDEILLHLPSHLNEKGYMGTIHEGIVHEQQLSGNGWLLRGLCEYYSWKHDEKILTIIRKIAENLFVIHKGQYKLYPITPSSRPKDEGKASGNMSKQIGKWWLSTDIGCVFIGMEGLIHAYQYVGTPEMKEVIEEMIGRFLDTDLLAIKAQTHASLTACRGLMRYAQLTGNTFYAKEAEKRWQLYKKHGQTENFANYNWFERFDTWTEPCAIVDSYMLACQLWEWTRKIEYREDAELIYYNALAHAQRSNGGFGCDNCPGKQANSSSIKVKIKEAHWCCTMRGGEGLASVGTYSYLMSGDTLLLPFYQKSKLNSSEIGISQDTNYPFDNEIKIKIDKNQKANLKLGVPIASWMKNITFLVNGKRVRLPICKGFAIIPPQNFKEGNEITIHFEKILRKVSPNNLDNNSPSTFKWMYGPLLLAVSNQQEVNHKENSILKHIDSLQFINKKGVYFTPLYHLIDKAVNATYSRQILFE